MKRRDLEKRLRLAGCILKREGGSHSPDLDPNPSFLICLCGLCVLCG